MSARRTTLAVPAPTPEPGLRLDRLLDGLGERLAEAGTAAAWGELEVLAEATRVVAPGAAAALVDGSAAEVTRLRAYGVLHGVVRHGLDAADRAWLLARLEGREPAAEARVA